MKNGNWRIQGGIAGFPVYEAGTRFLSSLKWHFATWAGAYLPVEGMPIDNLPADMLDAVRVTRNGQTWTGD